jgi:hypothetical protein
MATVEQIAQYYEGLCKVVDNINAGKPDNMIQASWDIHSSINIEWLKIIVNADFWTDEDMTAVHLIID